MLVQFTAFKMVKTVFSTLYHPVLLDAHFQTKYNIISTTVFLFQIRWYSIGDHTKIDTKSNITSGYSVTAFSSFIFNIMLASYIVYVQVFTHNPAHPFIHK